MKYTPNGAGEFTGQAGYGYRSIEDFVEAANAIRSQKATVADFEGRLATIGDTVRVTAILEAERRSLDDGGRMMEIVYDESGGVSGLTYQG